LNEKYINEINSEKIESQTHINTKREIEKRHKTMFLQKFKSRTGCEAQKSAIPQKILMIINACQAKHFKALAVRLQQAILSLVVKQKKFLNRKRLNLFRDFRTTKACLPIDLKIKSIYRCIVVEKGRKKV